MIPTVKSDFTFPPTCLTSFSAHQIRPRSKPSFIHRMSRGDMTRIVQRTTKSSFLSTIIDPRHFKVSYRRYSRCLLRKYSTCSLLKKSTQRIEKIFEIFFRRSIRGVSYKRYSSYPSENIFKIFLREGIQAIPRTKYSSYPSENIFKIFLREGIQAISRTKYSSFLQKVFKLSLREYIQDVP